MLHAMAQRLESDVGMASQCMCIWRMAELSVQWLNSEGSKPRCLRTAVILRLSLCAAALPSDAAQQVHAGIQILDQTKWSHFQMDNTRAWMQSWTVRTVMAEMWRHRDQAMVRWGMHQPLPTSAFR